MTFLLGVMTAVVFPGGATLCDVRQIRVHLVIDEFSYWFAACRFFPPTPALAYGVAFIY